MKPPHIKEQRQKQIRKIYKRFRQISKEQRALGYKKLDKPIRHGWYKEIVITSKVSRYKSESAILEIFEKIEKVFWGRTKKEADAAWQKQTSEYLIYRDFPTLSKKQYNKLSFKAQRLCTVYQYKNKCKKWRKRFYIRIPKNAYRIKYTRAYITHCRRIDPKLESEDALLDQQLLKQGYFNLNQVYRRWWYEKYSQTLELKRNRYQTKQHLHQLKYYDINEVLKENISWEKN